jgi:tetratricopeptide (TPR) repeat protein
VSLVPLIDQLGRGAQPWPAPLNRTAIVVVGASPAGRRATAARVLAQVYARDPHAQAVVTPSAADWPFTHPLVDADTWPAGAVVLWTPDLHEAFVNAQGNATRLVTTQPTYLLQLWSDAMQARGGVTFVATADRRAMQEHAPEALDGRGPWADVVFVDADDLAPDDDADVVGRAAITALPAAFRLAEAAGRLAAAGRAVDEARTPARLLALASVCMEVNDLDNAGALLAEAAAAAPGWAAAAFEHGKYWLRRDDMAAACAAFGRASTLLPTFASAAANWGATLGELDRPEEALSAFTRALAADPANAQAVNNVGVVTRELGRLSESEAAFRRVIALTPDLAFGHYNLGHTLFLQGRYQASLSAYSAGQQQDPARNPVQASRLALARLATGDAAGALRELQGCTATLPRDYRRQLLGDTQVVAWALLSAAPDLRDWRVVGDWLAAELAKP